MELYGSLSRLFTPADLNLGAETTLPENHAHYLRNVLRKNPGDTIRLFNGRDGEWLAEIATLGKKSGSAKLTKKLRDQPPAPPTVHLLFAPIKKARLDFLIEKAVELGVTHLHPVITARTENRNLNAERLQAQIIEATEQCERMDVPIFFDAMPLDKKIAAWNAAPEILWCFERSNAESLGMTPLKNPAFLIGPEGGFDDREIRYLSEQAFIKSVSLGAAILRAETAAIFCLACVKSQVLRDAS